MSKGVLEFTKQKQEHESLKQKRLSQLGTEVTRKDSARPTTESRGVICMKTIPSAQREKVSPLHSFF